MDVLRKSLTGMDTIDQFVDSLAARTNSRTVCNPYRTPHIADNLQVYLDAVLSLKQPRILLIGEAPGYRGCRITGIPFSSGKLFEECEHWFIQSLAPKIQLEQVVSETTAKIVWEYLSGCPVVPLFWNSFPFHPHPAGRPDANRAPNRKEMQEGGAVLKGLAELFKPAVIAGVGRKGELSAQMIFPEQEIHYIRHPSYGGKREFIVGMDQLFTP